ncbi:MAG: hypothetical protein ABIP53_05195 [Candidatus Limnocylindrales bacterium]
MSETKRASVDFTLGGLSVRLTLAGERWIARVGESVAVAGSARRALAAALEPATGVSASVLLADLALLAPSIEVAAIETAAARPA